MKCPKCGFQITAEMQKAGGKARWRGLTKAQRSAAASKAAKARWSKEFNPAHATLIELGKKQLALLKKQNESLKKRIQP